MTDLLERLRDADPIDRDAIEISARSCAPVCSQVRRRRHVEVAGSVVLAGGGIAASLAIALVVIASIDGGRSGLDLADRAYAATTGPGIVHWRTEVETRTNGRDEPPRRIEGWARGGVQHIIYTDVRGRRAVLTSEERIVGTRMQAYVSSADIIFDRPTPTTKATTALGTLPPGDPLAAFRAAYRIGRLRPAAANRYVVRAVEHNPRVRQTTTYELDPETAEPVQLVSVTDYLTTGAHRTRHSVATLRFALYERLSDSAANRSRLVMRPHPGARREAFGRIAPLRVRAAFRRAQADG